MFLYRSSYVLLFLLFAFSANGQDTALQIDPDNFIKKRQDSVLRINLDDLIINTQISTNFDKRTEIGEIKNLYKLSVWNFAPGLSYDFIRNRCYVTISTSGLYNHFIGKRQEQRRIGAIERKYRAKNLGDELKITNSVLAVEADYKDLILAKKSVQIEIDIFIIQKEQYKRNEIDTEKFLTAKKNIINTIKNHNGSVTELYKKILELSNLSNTPIELDFDTLYFGLDFLEE